MSEHDGDGGKTGAFLLGFLVGVLVCLGAGGAFFVVGQRQTMMEAERAAHEAMAARDAREAAMQAAERADKALKELKAKEKDAKDKPKE